MRQEFSVSRRNAVALVAGGFAAAAAPAVVQADHMSALTGATAVPGVGHVARSYRRLLDSLHEVRRAIGMSGRGHAFDRFAATLSAHRDVEELYRSSVAASGATALYRHRDPDAVLVDVILRELQNAPRDAAWMTRFGELEAVIHAQARTRAGLV